MFSSLQKFNPLRAAASVGLKSTLPKVLVGAALLGGGASLLSAGNAQAVQVFCGGGATVGDKTISNIVCNGFTTNPPVDPATGFMFFTEAGITYDFAAIFDPLLTAPGSISYTLAITDPTKSFARVELDSSCDDVATGACNVQKDVFYGALGSAGTGNLVLTSLTGEQDFENFAPGISTINVLDTWSPTGSGALRGVENVYTQTSVPGPLPLLGAGMAFGFSRKLRSRIKARVQA